MKGRTSDSSWVLIGVQLNSGTVIEVGPGVKNKEGDLVPLDVKKGDLVLLPEYGGSMSNLKAESKATCPALADFSSSLA